MSIFLNIMYVIIVMLVFLYPGYMLTRETYRLASGGDKAPMSVAIQGVIPIWNNVIIRRQLYGAAGNILKIYFALVPIVVLRIVALVTRSDILLLVTAGLDLVGICICWLLAAYVALDVGRMVEVSGFKIALCIITPPLGCYVVARSIGPYITHSNDELEDTFLENERSSD